VVGVLRLSCRVDGGGFVVGARLEGAGAPQAAEVRVGEVLSARDREDVRWYLEDYLQYPVDPAPEIAGRVEGRLAELGAGLFREVFEGDRDAIRLWDAVAGDLAGTRVEVDGGVEAGAVPWELLRDPVTDGVLALRAGAFVRTLPGAGPPPPVPEATGGLRVLLVICRPGGRLDVPFRSVASHLVRLSRGAREAFDLDVLRPPSFAALARVLGEARERGEPYHVVHFDGHGAWLDAEQATAAEAGGEFANKNVFSLVSPPRPGSHGYLVFEDPGVGGGRQLVDGPALGQLLAGAGVPVLVLNACRSAHAGLVTAPQEAGADQDAHRRVRAYGSLAQEVMDAGVAGVVAMAYNVYVVTAAVFIAEVYAGLLAGRALGVAVAAARAQLAANPVRVVGLEPRPLQDWVVPVVYEAAPLTLHAKTDTAELRIDLSQAEAGQERAGLEGGLPAGPDAGFYGRDESLLALDRAFDDASVVLLHAWAGAGKTTTALEFARWYALTGGTSAVLFTSFEHHLTLARLLDQAGNRFAPALEHAGVQWATLDDTHRRDIVLQVLGQVPVLWVWDNIEPVAGFPAGTPSAWTPGEQDELRAFLRQLAQDTQCKVLLTSRRDEQGWLGDLPARVALPAMPMLERLELARAIAAHQDGGTRAFQQVQDWRPLLEFTQGNPLTITILVRQALRQRYTTPAQIRDFVGQLRDGAADVTDDKAQGRSASLAASLNYGLEDAFTEQEREILALLALFQGFTDIDALCAMGNPAMRGGPVPAVAGLDRDTGIALLDKAAETGLLTAYGGGYYAVHPAIPWHLHNLFEQHHGPPDSPTATQALYAWAQAISELGNYYHDLYGQGHAEVIGVLSMEEANLVAARRHALSHGWYDLIGPMQGLRNLYGHTGRTVEWRRLVDELIPTLTNPDGGPRPGLEEEWSILTEYRVSFAQAAREWTTARQLLDARIAWSREQAAAALDVPPDQLSDLQRNQIRSLVAALHELGEILREQEDPSCVHPYQETAELSQRIGAHQEEGAAAFNLGHAYKNIPALRDLDQAEDWYRRAGELFGAHDTLGQAIIKGQLGGVAYQRFREARNAGASDEELLRYLNAAADGFHQQLSLIPGDAVNEHAVAHNWLGIIYGDAGDANRALGHYQKAIHYRERQDNTYGAGLARYNAATTLGQAGRRHDALLYARAALRDFETTGPGAAEPAEEARQFITLLEQGGSHEPPATSEPSA
jgi:tetratricopeptide (TPR) repeat protein